MLAGMPRSLSSTIRRTLAARPLVARRPRAALASIAIALVACGTPDGADPVRTGGAGAGTTSGQGGAPTTTTGGGGAAHGGAGGGSGGSGGASSQGGSGGASSQGGGGASSQGGSGGASSQGGSGGAGGSAIGRPCDVAAPCPAGTVCEEGRCEIDCGANARCDGEVCCAPGDVCYLGACTPPGSPCGPAPGSCAAPPCPAGEQCDPTLGACMPMPPSACVFTPDKTFEPTLLWAWTGSSAHPAYAHVVATPAAADLDGDGASDVVVPVGTIVEGSPYTPGILCALAGTGDCAGAPRELWCTDPADKLGGVNIDAAPAVADLDGSGQLTIVAGAARVGAGPVGWAASGLVAFDAKTGARIPGFGTDANGKDVDVFVGVGAPGIADFDGDGKAEVFVGLTVFDSQGKLAWQGPASTGNATFGPLSIAADLDGDGHLDLVTGHAAYKLAKVGGVWQATPLWAGAPASTFEDGWPAVADFDGDGLPEVVVVAQSNKLAVVRVFDRKGALFAQNAFTLVGYGGPPTIADVDGDGVPDIAVAGQNQLTVLRVQSPKAAPTLAEVWHAKSQDNSSSFTGSSVFDFDGDGDVEVAYGDECYARVYDKVGSERFRVPNTSCTATEYPIVVDLTGDGKAELVLVSNDMQGNAATPCRFYVDDCQKNDAAYQPTHGVRVFRDAHDNWVATRPTWNQHGYHVTNVCDGRDAVCPPNENSPGRVPSSEPASVAFPAGAPLNRYRANARVDTVRGAPNLVPSKARVDLAGCPGTMTLRASVTNVGAIGAPAGVSVAFYRVEGGKDVLVGVATTKQVLLPGGSEAVHVDYVGFAPNALQSFVVSVDDGGAGVGQVSECDENDDRASFQGTCGTGAP
jgi:hypothetical protein